MMEECKEARKNMDLLSGEIVKNGEISWVRNLKMAGYDELVYRLTLKYLRQKGNDIGYDIIPRIKAQNLQLLHLVEV